MEPNHIAFNVTIGDHHLRWQMTGADRTEWQVSGVLMGTRETQTLTVSRLKLNRQWPDTLTGAKFIFHAHWALCTLLMDVIVLYRGHKVHIGIVWHISNDFTSPLIAMHWKSGSPNRRPLRAGAVSQYFLNQAKPNNSLQSVVPGARPWRGLWVMWSLWLAATLHKYYITVWS